MTSLSTPAHKATVALSGATQVLASRLQFHWAGTSGSGVSGLVTRRLAYRDACEDSMPTEQGRLSTGTILIVEDDPTVLEVIRTILVSAGHTVVAAKGGLQALETFPRINPPVLLLLTDVMMPDLTGPALAERLLALDPTLRVLFVSGYYDTQIVQGLVKQFPVLRKPFTPSKLLHAIGNILEVSRS